jgi:hypothetical protein
MKKRSEPRINRGFLVEISRRGMEQMGVTVNLSRRGMCIATTRIQRRHSRLRVLIAAADEIYSISGLVVWHLRREAATRAEVPAELGILIEDAPPGYRRFVAAARRDSHPAAKPGLAC